MREYADEQSGRSEPTTLRPAAKLAQMYSQQIMTKPLLTLLRGSTANRQRLYRQASQTTPKPAGKKLKIFLQGFKLMLPSENFRNVSLNFGSDCCEICRCGFAGTACVKTTTETLTRIAFYATNVQWLRISFFFTTCCWKTRRKQFEKVNINEYLPLHLSKLLTYSQKNKATQQLSTRMIIATRKTTLCRVPS